jgi:leucyl aminopeptidase (aminopeptidase T)
MMNITIQRKPSGKYFIILLMTTMIFKNSYNIDYPNSSLRAFAKKICTKPPMSSTAPMFRMSADKWHSLDDESKDIWDFLDEKEKLIILGYSNDLQSSLNPRVSFNGSSSSNRTPPYKSPMKTQANLHDISAYDFILANMHDVNVNQ